ncbi:non-heme ferritin [Thiolapillus brandeum]|uniref:Ferritin n=1 Tax=Thiolapillus brandeum TaxID=1076588 RepID=A0A7U6GHJ5_9GAMM|nr:non-heme ferritin [Thiolapillus brandeum]BAO43752.1 ferritin [Thiolapillus brandeum]
MLSNKLIDQLNKQINLEFYSSNLYLQMSAWASYNGLDGSAGFLRNHAAEEMDHMHRLFTYVSETGALPLLGSIEAPPTEFDSIHDVFEKIYAHECHVTSEINHLAECALDEKDFSTFNFLQWYVAEQHEEERLFKSILDKLRIIGVEGTGLYHFDQQMAEFTSQSAA